MKRTRPVVSLSDQENETEISRLNKQIKTLQKANAELEKSNIALQERYRQKLSEWGRRRITPEFKPKALA